MNERAEENGTPATVEELDEQLSGCIATNIMQVIGSVWRDSKHTDYSVIHHAQRTAVQAIIKNQFAGFYKDARNATTELSTLRAENERLRETEGMLIEVYRHVGNSSPKRHALPPGLRDKIRDYTKANCAERAGWLPDSNNKES